MSNIGRRLIIDKNTMKVVHDFGEVEGVVYARPKPEDLIVIDLEYGQYSDEFSKVQYLKDGLNSITVTNLANKVLNFDFNQLPLTPEQQIAELQQQLLIAQGVI